MRLPTQARFTFLAVTSLTTVYRINVSGLPITAKIQTYPQIVNVPEAIVDHTSQERPPIAGSPKLRLDVFPQVVNIPETEAHPQPQPQSEVGESPRIDGIAKIHFDEFPQVQNIPQD